MNRNPHFLVTGMQKLDVCGSEMIYLKGSAYEKPFPIKYYPIPEHNLENCKGCQKTHQQILKEVGDYFKDFPNCCDRHKNLQKHSLFKKEDFDSLAQIVADKVIYMHHHILNNLDQDNWEEEINNYLEYAVTSFGQTPENCGEPPALSWFMDYTKRMQLNHKLVGDDAKYKERQKKVIDNIENYYKPKSKGKKDFNLLLSTYDKWYKFFPFDIPLFSDLKKHYSRTLPILAEKPKTNPYLGTAKVELLSQSQLLKNLSNITNNILLKIDTTKLLADDYISNKTKYSFDLKKKSHSVRQASLLSKPTKNEKEYIKTIKSWLKNEKEFINDIKDDIAIKNENKTTKDLNNGPENNHINTELSASLKTNHNTMSQQHFQKANFKDLLLAEELEKRAAIKAVEYKTKIDELWQTYTFDPTYFDTFISGDLYNVFLNAIYERIKPLNDFEINKYLTLSVNQFKTHTPEKRAEAFKRIYHDTYWYPNQMEYKENEHDDKYAMHVWKHYTNHFHLFKEATENVLQDFKKGLIGNGRKQEVIEKPKVKLKSKHQSFTYINNLTGQTQLTDLMNALKRKNLIENSTDLKDFRKVFSGEVIENPITWTGNISELTYFIKQLHNNLKFVQNVKQEIWSVTINCFIQENGEQYNRTKLRTQKVPATSKNIDMALKTL